MSNYTKFTYLGHSAVLVHTANNRKVIFDPWLDGNPACPADKLDPGQLDLICITHGHSDHVGQAISLAKSTGAKICANFELCCLLEADGVPNGQLHYMNKGGASDISALGLKIILTNAFHSSSYQTASGQTVYGGEACGIIMVLEDGESIYHAGDTAIFGDMALLGELYRPEVCFLPIGDVVTMGPRDAALATKLIRPDVVIPVHYNSLPYLTGTPTAFAEEVEALGVQTEVVILQPGETYTSE